MYLKTIEIVGFKSFAEKTRLDFKPGVTGIIGPNGCGKSNIMEAVRWCIGEMSWKSLRSDSMVSVIFAGTARRSPLSLAEVTLVFDNAQSMLPVQYSEVSVTRRIFRSGESEYWLNKAQCRLKDIRELFLDTGLGGDGYAIIDQGGVDFVLASKPEDRRALFEEAAGVAKYKAKREEALRKLERLEIDLARLNDNASLIDEQIKKLDSDARKAKLYQKYKDELRVLESRQIVQEIVQLGAEVSAETSRVAPVSDRLSELKGALAAEEGRLAALALERSEQEAAAMESNQKIAALKSEIGRLEERIHHARQTTEEIQGRLSASRQDLAREARRAVELEPELERAGSTYSQAASRRDEARGQREDFHQGLSRLEAESSAALTGLEELRAQLLQASGACSEAARGLSEAEKELGQLDYQARSTLREHQRKEASIEAGRQDLNLRQAAAKTQGTRREEAQKELSRREDSASRLRGALGEIASRAQDLHTESARFSAKVEALKCSDGRDPYWVGAHAALNAGIAGLIGTVSSLMRVEEAYRPYVEDALGERLYAVVCEHSSAAKSAIEFLKGSGKGRARFLVSGSLPERISSASFPPDARTLLDHVSCEPEHEKVLRYLLSEAYVLADGLYGPHWVCGGAPEAEGRPLRLSDLQGLETRLKVLASEEAASERQKAAWEGELAEVEEKVKLAAAAFQEENAKWYATQAQCAQAEEILRLHEREVQSLEDEAANILREMALAKETIYSLKALTREREAHEQTLRQREAEALERRDTLKEELVKRRAQEAHLDSVLENLQSQSDFHKAQLDRLVLDKESLARSIERRHAEQEEWNNRLKELMRVEAESHSQLDGHHRALATLEGESQDLFGALARLRQATEVLESAVREKKAESSTLLDELHASQLKVSQLTASLELLKKRLAEEWSLDFDQIQAEAQGPAAEEPVDAEKVQFLRRRIEALGNVNMAAPEEYAELKSKRDFLQSQVDDLVKAKEDLRAAIAKINATTRENFRQTFHEVREHFRKLYGVLFEGGEADLVLTDQENLLDTGVEIVAQPPGKRLQSIALLSGGEKTLTAIALLFAFFMVKPSPMCMLDEADAALDDANVERFVSLIREFVGKTQFLIVSHNKKTMEACNVIYGVTMEESGISQVISVDFKKRTDQEKRAEGESAAATAS